MSPDARGGATLIETLVTLLLTAIVLSLTWTAVVRFRGAVEDLVARSEALQTERTTWHTLAAEVRAGSPRDRVVLSREALELRAFRGVAHACPEALDPDAGTVAYEGDRLPDPRKDSLLVLDAGGGWSTVRITSREPAVARCESSGASLNERWGWEPDLEKEPVLLRVFERGSYHLANDAFRYRIGAAGRQPLTPSRLVSDASSFSGDSLLTVRIEVAGGAPHHTSIRTLGAR